MWCGISITARMFSLWQLALYWPVLGWAAVAGDIARQTDMPILNFANITVQQLTEAQRKLGIGGDFVATSYTSDAPVGGTAAAWKLGSVVVGSVTVDTSRYVEVQVGNQVLKLIVAT